MYIKEIFIESFGHISNKTYSFSDGVNLLYGPNESGKTTVLDFVFFLFYGFKGKNNRDNAILKNKYIASQNNFACGRASFVSQGLEYVLRRVYSGKSSEISLFCITTGGEIKDSRILGFPGEYFFGITQTAFLKTAYFSSLSAKISADSTDEIITKLRNLFESGNVDISYKEISNILSEQIATLESPRRKNAEIPLLESEIKQTTDKICKINSDNENFLNEKHNAVRLKTKIKSLNEEIEQCVSVRNSVVNENPKKYDIKNLRINFLFCIISFVLSISLLLFNGFASAVMFVVSLFITICVFVVIQRERRRSFETEKRKLFTLKEIDDKIDMLRSKKSDAELRCAVIEEKLSNSSSKSDEELREQLEMLESRHVALKKRLAALKLSLECVNKAYDDMKVLFSPELSGRAGDILGVLSNGKYSNVLINDSFVIKVLTEKGYIDASCLSTGALEQTYISLRFALVDLILNQKNTPLFLDDAFAFFDSKNLKNVNKYIKDISKVKQIFIASCREEEYLIFKEISKIIIF